jgi:hypothetical protein
VFACTTVAHFAPACRKAHKSSPNVNKCAALEEQDATGSFRFQLQKAQGAPPADRARGGVLGDEVLPVPALRQGSMQMAAAVMGEIRCPVAGSIGSGGET